MPDTSSFIYILTEIRQASRKYINDSCERRIERVEERIERIERIEERIERNEERVSNKQTY